jgi:type I restriction enzyme S subunit
VEEAENLVNSQARKMLSTAEAGITELRDWLDSNRNGIQTGPFGSKLSSSDFTDIGTPVLTIGNVQYNGLDLDDLKHVSQEKAKELERYTLEEGDILFARMGTVGRCCVVPKEAEGWIINYHIIRVALDKSRVEPRYIHWIIQTSADVNEYLDENIRGATRAGVNSKIVGSLPCRVPSLTQQRRIVAYLDDLQAKVEAVRQHQAATAGALDALLSSILDQAFKGEL